MPEIDDLLQEDGGAVDILLYYQIKVDKKYGVKKIIILEDEKAKKLLADEEKKDDIQVLNTKWKQVSWSMQNNIINQSQRKDAVTGQLDIDWSKYRDTRIKKLLTDWDLTRKGRKEPVSDKAIDGLPAEIVLALFDRYEKATLVGEDELEKF